MEVRQYNADDLLVTHVRVAVWEWRGNPYASALLVFTRCGITIPCGMGHFVADDDIPTCQDCDQAGRADAWK